MSNMQPYIERYMKDVLGVYDVDVYDSPVPHVMLDTKTSEMVRINGKRQMGLPMTDKALQQVLGPDLTEMLSEAAKWSLLIGNLFHEMGHLISGEPSPKTRKQYAQEISNIINDANENTVIPAEWPGATDYIDSSNMLIDSIMPSLNKADQDPADMTPAELRKQLSMAMGSYRPGLRIKYDDEHVVSFPDDHPNHDVFEDLKLILEDARQHFDEDLDVFRSGRARMIAGTYKRVKQHWEDVGGSSDEFDPEPPEDDGDSGDQQQQSQGGGMLAPLLSGGGGNGQSTPQPPKLSKDDKKRIQKAIKQLDGSDVESDLDQIKAKIKWDETAKQKGQEQGIVDQLDGDNKAENLPPEDPDIPGDGHGFGYEPPPGQVAKQLDFHVDLQRAATLRSIIKRLMFDRDRNSRRASKIGTKMYPPNFYQIKTNPRKAKLRVDELEMSKTRTRTEMVLMFDCSISMNGVKHRVAKEVMATLFKATKGLRDLKIHLFAFSSGHLPDRIQTYSSDLRVYQEIQRLLHPRGGTDLPLAYKVALDLLRTAKSQRKYIVILTDGDALGSYDMKHLHLSASRKKIVTMGIGVGDAPSHMDGFDNYQFVGLNLNTLPALFTDVMRKAVR